MGKYLHIILILSLSLWVTGLAGCSGKSIDENDPASLYKDAEDDIQSDNYQIALDKLKSIRNRFPYSKYAVDSQLRIADVYYLQESYPEAAQVYESFRDLHPKHERTPYVLFRIGMSYYKEMPGTIARDLSPASKALDAFNEFLGRFPSSSDAVEARKALSEVRNALADKELYVGHFYYKSDRYDAALNRYKKVIEFYSDTKAAKAAQERIDSIGRRTKTSIQKEDPTANGKSG